MPPPAANAPRRCRRRPFPLPVSVAVAPPPTPPTCASTVQWDFANNPTFASLLSSPPARAGLKRRGNHDDGEGDDDVDDGHPLVVPCRYLRCKALDSFLGIKTNVGNFGRIAAPSPPGPLAHRVPPGGGGEQHATAVVAVGAPLSPPGWGGGASRAGGGEGKGGGGRQPWRGRTIDRRRALASSSLGQ